CASRWRRRSTLWAGQTPPTRRWQASSLACGSASTTSPSWPRASATSRTCRPTPAWSRSPRRGSAWRRGTPSVLEGSRKKKRYCRRDDCVFPGESGGRVGHLVYRFESVDEVANGRRDEACHRAVAYRCARFARGDLMVRGGAVVDALTRRLGRCRLEMIS